MPLLIFLWGIYYFFCGAVININQGFAAYRYLYRPLANDIYFTALLQNNIHSYYLGKTLDS